MKTIEAIFFDIDGTLLSFNTGRIPESAKQALLLLKDKGIKIFIATGRAKAEMEVISELYFDGYVSLNGQFCYDKDNRKIFGNALHKDDVKELVNFSTSHQIPCFFVEDNHAYYNVRNSYVDDVERIMGLDRKPLDDVERALENTIYQVSTYVNAEQEKELLALMPHSTSARWYPSFCDIFPKNGSKLLGINEVCKYYNISIENTMAFGDAENDLAMLSGVGLSVAMGNASQEAKNVANYITDDVDSDGIYNALKHFNIL